MNQIIQQLLQNRFVQISIIFSLTISLGYVFIYFFEVYKSKIKAKKEKGYLIQVIPPKYFIDDNNKQGARFALQRFMDNLTASLKTERISFEIYADNKGIKFQVWTPNERIKDLVKLNLYSTYGERIQIKDIINDPIEDFKNSAHQINEYKTAKHDVYMLMDLKDFEAVDPIDGILGAMIGLENNDKLLFQIVLKPTKLDKVSIEKAKENFRLRKSEITWSFIFFNQIESYLIFLIPLLPILLVKLVSLISSNSNKNEKDTVKLLHDSDPRKILVQQDELSEFNKRINEKFKTAFTTYIRVISSGSNPIKRLDYIEQALEAMKSETQNKLIRKKTNNFNDLKTRYIYPEDKNFPFYRELLTSQKTLSSREVSMLYHLPRNIIDSSIEHFTLPNISAKEKFRNKNSYSDLWLGINSLRENETNVYLDEESRKRHVVITGQTGTGKSTILKNFLLQDIDNRFLKEIKRGLLLLDPHEDLFLDVINKLPDNRSNNLIIWDNRSEDFYFGLNPLYAIDLSEREIDLVVDSNYKLIEKLINRVISEGGMGVTGKPMLINAMKTLMIFQLEWLRKNPDKRERLEKFAPTLTDIRSLFISDEFLSTILSFIPLEKYEDLRSFWEDILPNYKESRVWTEIRQGFDNKVSQLLNGVLYYTFAQSQNSINISECLRESKIILVNLSPKNIGEEGMSLLGSFLIAKFWFEAKKIAQDLRIPFAIYADEFQNFATSDFSFALSEARKFNLELILAHQFFQQLPQDVFHSVIGNVKTKIFYRAGQEDAEIIDKELQGKILEKEIMEIPEFNAIVKASEDIFTIRVPKERANTIDNDKAEKLILSSYFRFGKSKWEIEEEIIDRRNWFRDGCL